MSVIGYNDQCKRALEHTEAFESVLKAGAFEHKQLKRSRVYWCKRLLKSAIHVYLQHVFKALIIVANHRHI